MRADVAAVALILLSFLIWRKRLPWLLLPWTVVTSLVAYALYARDKRAATEGRWRIPEGNLLLVGLFGGLPGAFAAQRRLRHKSRKVLFQVVFWLSVGVNVVALGWLATAEGRHALDVLGGARRSSASNDGHRAEESSREFAVGAMTDIQPCDKRGSERRQE